VQSGVNFINTLRAAFEHADLKGAKKTDNLTVVFCALRICNRKSCSWKVGEIDPKCHPHTLQYIIIVEQNKIILDFFAQI
jgi:hypothetical protein